MHTSRITNASLFVTVLSACLGLLMTGVPSQAQTQRGANSAFNQSQALVAGVAVRPLSSQQVLKLAAACNSYFRIAVCQAHSEPSAILYQNSRALADRNQLLVVTRLPRAGLTSPLAE
jgi:hypothetical protein